MFCRIARAVEVLQRHRSLLRRDTNEVISDHLVAQALAKKLLRDINPSVAAWLCDFMDFEFHSVTVPPSFPPFFKNH